MKKIQFITNGTTVDAIEFNEETASDKLKNQIYQVSYAIDHGFYLTIFGKRFDIGRLYGDIESRADKIINTYKSRSGSTGVLLTGNKGSGKSLLTKVIGNKLIDEQIPVLLITSCHSGPAFDKFLSLIGNCVLIFDEFAKTFGRSTASSCDDNPKANQEDLLTLFDGMSSRKRLILLTENSTYHIDDHLLDRPSRIFYHFRYEKLPPDFITEFCESKKVGSDIVKDIISYSKTADEFSYDMLAAIVEEHLRYRLPIDAIIPDLNISDICSEYEVIIHSCINITTDEKLEPVQRVQIIPSLDEFSLKFFRDKEIQQDLRHRLVEMKKHDKSMTRKDVEEQFNQRKCVVFWFEDHNSVWDSSDGRQVFETGDIRMACEIRPRKRHFSYDALFDSSVRHIM
jgi:hypothetical protein